MLGILTADCLPILINDPKNHAIGAIHAGWRGLINNIIPNTIKKMIDTYQTDPQQLIVSIGPSIGPCCYEVKNDVANQVQTSFGANNIIRYTDQQAIYLDLRLAASIHLQQLGVQLANIEITSICTKDNPDRYFSYRARPNSGLNLSTISQNHIYKNGF
jgi:YfiH family protein